ncbi:MAG: diguanylate cyclase [Chitinophagales bacterium]
MGGRQVVVERRTRGEVAALIWRRWAFIALASLLLFLLRPRLMSQAPVLLAHAAFVVAGLVETAAVLWRPEWAGSPVHFGGTHLLSMVQVGCAVAWTGGVTSPLTLLYPIILASVAMDGVRWRDAVLVGAGGLFSFSVAVFSQAGGVGLLSLRFAVEAIALFGVFVGQWLLALKMAEKNLRLERSFKALEKFAAGLKATNEKLERLSFTDGVTGVFNYRYFQLRLREELSRARRYHLPVALMMVDVDGFKKYNDVHGHPLGDQVLKAVAEALKENVREMDTVCRYGGDEFAVILSDAKAETALQIAERVRRAVEYCASRVGAPAGITISLGIGVYPDNGESAETLIKAADEALYRVKLSRRNGVQVYSAMMDDLRVELGGLESPDLLNTLRTLITVINARDRYTYGHSERVVRYAELIGTELGLPADELRLLRYAAFLHDIGKIEIGREILDKRGPLSDEERAVIRKHTLYGVSIIEPIKGLERIVGIVLHHHERYDGLGYPAGLRGEEIPLLARVLAVADSFDAMMSQRPYREALGIETALAELRQGRGGQFDPTVTDAFLRAAERDPQLVLPGEWRQEVAAESHPD